jgi:hypothetical protein
MTWQVEHDICPSHVPSSGWPVILRDIEQDRAHFGLDVAAVAVATDESHPDHAATFWDRAAAVMRSSAVSSSSSVV